MFARKPVLPVDIDANQSDPEDLLDAFNEANSISATPIKEKHQAALERAKANILRAQQRQKEVYDRRHYKPGV